MLSWLAELGPMFFTIKEAGFSQREKRRMDKQEMRTMEDDMKEALKRELQAKEKEQSEFVQPRYVTHCQLTQKRPISSG